MCVEFLKVRFRCNVFLGGENSSGCRRFVVGGGNNVVILRLFDVDDGIE